MACTRVERDGTYGHKKRLLELELSKATLVELEATASLVRLVFDRADDPHDADSGAKPASLGVLEGDYFAEAAAIEVNGSGVQDASLQLRPTWSERAPFPVAPGLTVRTRLEGTSCERSSRSCQIEQEGLWIIRHPDPAGFRDHELRIEARDGEGDNAETVAEWVQPLAGHTLPQRWEPKLTALSVRWKRDCMQPEGTCPSLHIAGFAAAGGEQRGEHCIYHVESPGVRAPLPLKAELVDDVTQLGWTQEISVPGQEIGGYIPPEQREAALAIQCTVETGERRFRYNRGCRRKRDEQEGECAKTCEKGSEAAGRELEACVKQCEQSAEETLEVCKEAFVPPLRDGDIVRHLEVRTPGGQVREVLACGPGTKGSAVQRVSTPGLGCGEPLHIRWIGKRRRFPELATQPLEDACEEGTKVRQWEWGTRKRACNRLRWRLETSQDALCHRLEDPHALPACEGDGACASEKSYFVPAPRFAPADRFLFAVYLASGPRTVPLEHLEIVHTSSTQAMFDGQFILAFRPLSFFQLEMRVGGSIVFQPYCRRNDVTDIGRCDIEALPSWRIPVEVGISTLRAKFTTELSGGYAPAVRFFGRDQSKVPNDPTVATFRFAFGYQLTPRFSFGPFLRAFFGEQVLHTYFDEFGLKERRATKTSSLSYGLYLKFDDVYPIGSW